VRCTDFDIFVYRKIIFMRTNIDIDDKLLKEAMKYVKVSSKKDLVNHALDELIRLEKRKKLMSLKGKINWEGNLDEMRSI
jgi:Arc/MetJ family transcription regulator